MTYCSKCGAEVLADAAYCPKCGNPTAASSQPTWGPMGPRRHEKGEKAEKAEKHEKQEKSGPRDWTGPLVGGLILIWLGVTFYLVQIGYTSWMNWWGYFIFGIGIILIVQAAVRLVNLKYKGPAIGAFTGGLVLCAIGLAGIMGMRDWWPMILIAIGVIVIVSGLRARARSPKP
ncbi:MAG: zinc ribbon domain-containing protein [Thaumarchaeota archaeon]|nr:zinc ribbon domain-containing protein [Nitrososphaerota archaeon]